MMVQVFSGEISSGRSERDLLDVVCTAFRRHGELLVFLHAFLNQRDRNWRLRVIHDGPSLTFDEIAGKYAAMDSRISFESTPFRFNDFGHSLRSLGLAKSTAEYVLITNHDNYYPPVLTQFLNTALSVVGRPDVILFDMIHGHRRPGGRPQLSHTAFETFFKRENIDIGAAIVRGELAREAGFRGRDFAADALYFEDIARLRGNELSVIKIPRVLLYHN